MGGKLRAPLVGLLLLGCGRLGFDAHQPEERTEALVEYYMDEASRGQAPQFLQDRAEAPLDVPLRYVQGSPYWAEGAAGGGRHLRYWAPAGQDSGGASVDTNGTKLDLLHGAQQATLVVKYSVESCGGDVVEGEARLFGIGDGDRGDGNGWFAARLFEDREILALQFEGTSLWRIHRLGADTSACPVRAGSVVHWVLDTMQPAPTDRVRAYVDGERFATQGTPPSLGARLDLGAGARRLYVGQPHTPSTRVRTLQGRLWYAALYATAFTPERVKGDADRLTRDDTAATPPPVDPFAAFTTVEPVSELNSVGDEDDPTLTGDLLELYFERDTDLFRASRVAADEPWSNIMPVTELNTGGLESNPEVSLDGRTLYFDTNRQGQLEVFVATRESRSQPWSLVGRVDELNLAATGDCCVGITPDHRLLVLTSERSPSVGSWDLFVTERTDPTSTWGPLAPLGVNSTAIDFSPWLNATGTFLAFTSGRGPGQHLWATQRPDVGSAFEAPRQLMGVSTANAEDDAWLSPDLRVIYFSRFVAGNEREIFRGVR